MDYFLKSGAIIALFYISYKLFLQRETFFNSNRWFLIIGLPASVLLPLIVVPNYIYIEPAAFTGNFYVSENTLSQPAAHEKSFDIMQWFTYIYVAGVIVFFMKWVIDFSSLFMLLKSNRATKIGKFYIIKTDTDTKPFSFFKWIVYNPAHFTDTELQLIINHEKIHAKEWHSADVILSQLLSIIFWVNPVMWLYKKELQQNLEFIADQKAQQTSSCHKSYQKLLLKASMSHQQLVFVNNFYNSLIKKRIVMLQKSKSNSLNSWKYALILPALAFFIMSFNTKDVFIEKPAALSHSTSEAAVKPSENTLPKNDIIITKNLTDNDLANLKAALKEKGYAANFTKVERNDKGEITGIHVEVTSEQSNASYGVNSSKAILPIVIKLSDDHSIAISSNNGKKDQIVYVQQKNDGNDDNTTKTTTDNTKVITVTGKPITTDTDVITVIKPLKTDTLFIKTDVKKIISAQDINASENGNIIVYSSYTDTQSPMFIVNGEVISKSLALHLDPGIIESITVLKDEKAIAKYDEKGKHGVLEITLKDSKPSDVVYKLKGVSLIDNNNADTTKDASIYINKKTKDVELELHKMSLKSFGIDVTYSKVKRDKAGNITSIKISLDDNKGQKSSATYQDSSGIPKIFYGVVEGKLTITNAVVK